MSYDDRMQEVTSRSLTTQGFQTDTLIYDLDRDHRELARMEDKAMVDAIAEQIQHRKTKLATVLGHDLAHQSMVVFLEELEACDRLALRAEQLKTTSTRKAFRRYIDRYLDQFERFLLYNSLGGARNISQIAHQTPYPSSEEQRSWLRRIFSGD